MAMMVVLFVARSYLDTAIIENGANHLLNVIKGAAEDFQQANVRNQL
jgi:hypothetical protein